VETTVAKIQVLSDVHLEFGSLTVPKTDADVIVLAGDVHVGAEAVRWGGRLSQRHGVPVVMVAGNHEFYGDLGRPGASLGNTIAKLHAAAAASKGQVVFLECETAVVAGVRFLGCTLWTDFDLYGDPAEAMAHAEIGMSDFYTIANRAGSRFTTNDARREFLAARDFLTPELAKPFEGPTVVVTHHLPSIDSVAPRFKKDMLSAAYASRLDQLVASSNAALWIHGHAHNSSDYTIGTTRVLCNPRGYSFALNRQFNSKLVVEVGASRTQGS
jgi:predicted phosphodiesterase